MLDPVKLYHSPSPSLKPQALNDLVPSGTTPSEKPKRTARACDVCRNNHRKCPGPSPESDSCARCINHHKVCTWDNLKTSSRQASASASPKSSWRRQASATASPQTQKIKKILIRRSKSVPSTELASSSTPTTPATPTPLEIDRSTASPAPSSTSSDECSEIVTPPVGQHQLGFDDQTQGITANGIEALQLQPPIQAHAVDHDVPPQPCEAEVLPDWYKDCLAVANKHDLLLFPMPLSSWEDRQLFGKTSRLETGLQIVAPSYVDPAPTQREALDLLDMLLVEERTVPSAEIASKANAQLDWFALRDTAADLSSDDEPYQPAMLSDSSVDPPSSNTPPSSPPSLPCNLPLRESIDIVVDDDDAMSEPEPDFSCDLSLETPTSPQEGKWSPYRHQKARDRFDSFLFSPCKCQLTPPQVSSSPAAQVEDSTDREVKSEAAFWDEGMPDVLSDASQGMALDECLRIEDVSMLE